MIAQWCARCLDLLIPFGCAGCDGPVGCGAVWCDACAEGLVPAAHAVLQSPGASAIPVLAAHAYAGPVQPALHRFKFSGRAELADRLGREVSDTIQRVQLPSDAILVPVPLTPQRLVERGYNQSALLAGSIARRLALAHRARALVRVHDGSHQVGANRVERAEQVSGAFRVGSRRIDQKNVILVDDVLTTGATATACAEALVGAGARVIAIATVARVL